MHKSLILLASATLLAGCSTMNAAGQDETAPRYSAEDEALYMARFNRLAEGGSGGTGLGGYDTLETVVGASQVVPLPVRAQPKLSAEALAKADAYVASKNTAGFIVWKDGKVEYERYYGDYDRGASVVGRSLAKPITAILIGRALQQGYIKSLDQPVADFITEWRGDKVREKILIRHLLDMRTGFVPQAMAGEAGDILNRAYLHPRHDDIIINEMPIVDEPGTAYEYANATSEMVAPVIERATGMRYAEYLSKALLEPLGAPGGTIWVNRPGGTAHSGCCVMLPSENWLRMAILLMNDGVWGSERLLPEGYVAEMRTGTPQNQYYGKGVWLAGKYIERRGYANPRVPYGKVLHSEPYLDKDIFLFDGNGNQVVYMIPSENMIILRTGDRPPTEDEWDNPYLPNLLIADANRGAGDSMPEPQPR